MKKIFEDMDEKLAKHYITTLIITILIIAVAEMILLIVARSLTAILFVLAAGAIFLALKFLEIMEIRAGRCYIYEGRVVDFEGGQTLWKALTNSKHKNVRTLIHLKTETNEYLNIVSAKRYTVNVDDIVRVYAKPQNLMKKNENTYECKDFYYLCVVASGDNIKEHKPIVVENEDDAEDES